mgnify:CR=1 FL=1
MMKLLKITILTDNPNSWIIPYVEELKLELTQHKVTHIYSANDVVKGDIMLILGCEKIIKNEFLTKHKSNVVVHPSNELNDEIKHEQGLITKKMVKEYINSFSKIKGIPQKGKDTFYPRRRLEASELDINLSIKEQFNILRVVDNKRYPSYFNYMGKKYIIKIDKEDEK